MDQAFGPILAAAKALRSVQVSSQNRPSPGTRRSAGDHCRPNLVAHRELDGWLRKGRLLKFVVNSNLGMELFTPCRTQNPECLREAGEEAENRTKLRHEKHRMV